jgi:hypothetical protein
MALTEGCEPAPADDHADGALQVGAMNTEPRHRGEPPQRGGVRVAIFIPDARGDQRQPRASGLQQRIGRAGVRPVVAHLQDVDRPEQPALQQQCLDRRLGIPGQQRAE